MRIGLNTGPVVVGRIGDDLRMDYTAQGETVNLAARLQAAAAPGGVLDQRGDARAGEPRVPLRRPAAACLEGDRASRSTRSP